MAKPIGEVYGAMWEQQRDETQAKQEELARRQREQLAEDTARQQQALQASSQNGQAQMPQIPSGLMNMMSSSGGGAAGTSAGASAGASAGSAGASAGGSAASSATGALASAGPWAALAAAVIANEKSARNGGHRRNGIEYVGDLITGDVAYQDADRAEKATGSKTVGSLWKAANAANPRRILKALF